MSGREKPSPTDESRQSDLAVMDAEEYKQKRRLRRILDARDKVEAKEDMANESLAAGQISQDAANLMVYKAVCEYIRECYNLLENYHDGELAEKDTDYWNEIQIGVVPFETQEDRVVVGLGEFYYLNEWWTEEWTETVSTRHGPNETRVRQRTQTIPMDLSLDAYLLLNRFLANETSLDLEFENSERIFEDWRQEK